MRRLPRFIPAIVLVVLYTMMVMSPLTPLVLRSPVIAHAITGGCVSDCSICGCSPERIASRTCCCWQKKHQQDQDNDDSDKDLPDCCKKKRSDPVKKITIICPRNCTGDKPLVHAGIEQDEILPYNFNGGNPVVLESFLTSRLPDVLPDWTGPPPDQPPKLSC